MTHVRSPPDPVLPGDAPSEWLSLAAQIVGLHPNGAATVGHAFAAQVEPATFSSLQLAHWTGQEDLPLPIMSFGEDMNGPCRRFGCDGEIEALSAAIPKLAGAGLADLIDALIPLADEIFGHGSDAQRDRLHDVITHAAELAIEADDLGPNLRMKARAMRLIYSGHPMGLEDGFREDALDGGSRAEQLALQIIAVTANAK